MNKEKNRIKPIRKKIRDSLSIKLVVLFIMILFLMIPISSIKTLIRERKARRDEAFNEVSSKWGKEQTITGPFLTIPYYKEYEIFNSETKKYDIKKKVQYLNVLPEKLNFSGKIIPEERYRGIFKVIVYQAEINTKGNFVEPFFSEHGIKDKDVIWDKAEVSFKISDFRSLQDEVNMIFDEKEYLFSAGYEGKTGISESVKTSLILDNDKDAWNFDFNLRFDGSSKLFFTPLGEKTKVKLTSTWKDPSFAGNFLPDMRMVSDSGFEANWEVLHLNRPIPQVYKSGLIGEQLLNSYNFGVSLYIPVDHYQKSERTVKYALLFIALTFMAFFSTSTINKVNIHPIQYILIGLALTIFYSLLLSLSEHISFNLSYWISSLSIIFLLGFYSNAIFKNKKFAMMLSGIIFVLYGFIFTLIQLQDFALLVGSIGLFIVVSILMYISLNPSLPPHVVTA
ncbi:MAG: cell envelope integrity protein CreD [Candidatus Cloacimonetes bacterium]|nr:cell envelope integrity protein CreD [Candidatus Cloacimonadota bacterium]